METLLPKVALALPPVLPDGRAVWLEIGFGGGEHLAAQAMRHPDVLLIGAEPFQNGVASALRHIDEAALDNVRLHMGDAREVMAALPDASVARAFILFPDPWPKARHNKRRLIQAGTVEALARVLKPGAGLRFATDWADYADWTKACFAARPELFTLTTQDASLAPEDHITTRYETKKLGDIAPVFLDWVRR